MSADTPEPTEQERVGQVILDILVDHPMWIGDDGRELDYLPEREARIADFIREAAAAVMLTLAN